MTRSTTKKTAAKKTAASSTTRQAPRKITASGSSSKPAATDAMDAVSTEPTNVREDTPNIETTDLDRKGDVCRYCGRDAETGGMCAKHAARRGVE